MKIEEIKEELSRQTDDQLLKLNIGCWDVINFKEVPCPYNQDGRCSRGAFLTSTLIGAHPNDCPMRRNKR